MPVAGTKNLVYYITIVGQEDQAFGIFIESTYRENPLCEINIADDIPFHVRFTGSSDSDGLIESDVYEFLFLRRFEDTSINNNLIAWFVATGIFRRTIIQHYTAGFNKLIGFAS